MKQLSIILLLSMVMFSMAFVSCQKDDNVGLGTANAIDEESADLSYRVVDGVLEFKSAEGYFAFQDKVGNMSKREFCDLEIELGYLSMYSLLNSIIANAPEGKDAVEYFEAYSDYFVIMNNEVVCRYPEMDVNRVYNENGFVKTDNGMYNYIDNQGRHGAINANNLKEAETNLGNISNLSQYATIIDLSRKALKYRASLNVVKHNLGELKSSNVDCSGPCSSSFKKSFQDTPRCADYRTYMSESLYWWDNLDDAGFEEFEGDEDIYDIAKDYPAGDGLCAVKIVQAEDEQDWRHNQRRVYLFIEGKVEKFAYMSYYDEYYYKYQSKVKVTLQERQWVDQFWSWNDDYWEGSDYSGYFWEDFSVNYDYQIFDWRETVTMGDGVTRYVDHLKWSSSYKYGLGDLVYNSTDGDGTITNEDGLSGLSKWYLRSEQIYSTSLTNPKITKARIVAYTGAEINRDYLSCFDPIHINYGYGSTWTTTINHQCGN